MKITREKVLTIVNNNINVVYGIYNSAVNINQSGTLNEEKLNRERKLFLKSCVEDLAPELVSKKQGYPHDDISEVEFETDFVIIKRKDFDKVLKYIEKNE